MRQAADKSSMILALESGIHKEVSVGCAVAKNVCSICGADWRQERCGHRKGEMYGDRLCVGILEEATDAYELLGIDLHKGLLDNIIYVGCPGNTRRILEDKDEQSL